MQNRNRVFYAGIAALLLTVPASAFALDQTCHTSSDYEITVTPAALVFERKNLPAQRLEMRHGVLAADDKPVSLGVEDRKRVAAFETRVRELVPKIKTIAQRGVDLMVTAIREEAADASPRSASDPQLNARIDARASELKLKIANSTTSREWRADALQGYMAVMLSDAVPLIGGDLAQKALDLTLKGDLAGVLALKDRAVALRAALEARIRAKLESLQPAIQGLCPSLRELDRLESGISRTLPGGGRINLLQFDP